METKEVDITQKTATLKVMEQIAPKSAHNISYRKLEPEPEPRDDNQKCETSRIDTPPKLRHIARSNGVTWPPLQLPGGSYGNIDPAPGPKAINGDEQAAAIAHLKQENEALQEIIVKLRDQIEWQVGFWERGLGENNWESMSACKRRLSRLKGSLNYMIDRYPAKLRGLISRGPA